MQDFCLPAIALVCLFIVLGTRHVYGGAFKETEAMTAAYESVQKIINSPNIHFQENFRKDLDGLKSLNNDPAQAVGNNAIPEFLSLLALKDRRNDVVEILGFTFLLFNAQYIHLPGSALTSSQKIERKFHFEVHFLNNVLSKGPVFGMGTSTMLSNNWEYYMMTFYRGNRILDKFIDILEADMLISGSATIRAMKFHSHYTNGRTIKPKDLEIFGNYTFIETPRNNSQTPESILLAALDILQPKSSKNLKEALKKTSLKCNNHVDEDAFIKAKQVSYGYALWHDSFYVYMGIFYTLDSIQNDAFPVVQTTCELKIPQFDWSYKPRDNISTGGSNNPVVNGSSFPPKVPGSPNNTVQHKTSNNGEDDEEEEEEEEPQQGQLNGSNSTPRDIRPSQEHTESASPVNSGWALGSSPIAKRNAGSQENNSNQRTDLQSNRQPTTNAVQQGDNKTMHEEIQKTKAQEKKREDEKLAWKEDRVNAIHTLITNYRTNHINWFKKKFSHKKEITLGKKALEAAQTMVKKVIQEKTKLPEGGLALLEDNDALKEHARRRILLFRMVDTDHMPLFQQRAENVLKEKVKCSKGRGSEKFNIKRLDLQFCGIDVEGDPQCLGQVVVGVVLTPPV